MTTAQLKKTPQVKEIISDYILLTYDIPAKQKALRYQFLKKAGQIGAMQYTESVYLLPYSEESFQLASEMATSGKAVIWKSHQVDETKAISITQSYGQHIQARCAMIEQRLLTAQEHITKGHLRRALTMAIRTGNLLKELAIISKTYKPQWFVEKLDNLIAEWKTVHSLSAET